MYISYIEWKQKKKKTALSTLSLTLPFNAWTYGFILLISIFIRNTIRHNQTREFIGLIYLLHAFDIITSRLFFIAVVAAAKAASYYLVIARSILVYRGVSSWPRTIGLGRSKQPHCICVGVHGECMAARIRVLINTHPFSILLWYGPSQTHVNICECVRLCEWANVHRARRQSSAIGHCLYHYSMDVYVYM